MKTTLALCLLVAVSFPALGKGLDCAFTHTVHYYDGVNRQTTKYTADTFSILPNSSERRFFPVTSPEYQWVLSLPRNTARTNEMMDLYQDGKEIFLDYIVTNQKDVVNFVLDYSADADLQGKIKLASYASDQPYPLMINHSNLNMFVHGPLFIRTIVTQGLGLRTSSFIKVVYDMDLHCR